MMLKDLKLAWPCDGKFRVGNAPEAEAAALYTMFANNGSGKLDFSAIIKMLRGTC
jgi:3-hydroxyisobutyrate dehydrogenase